VVKSFFKRILKSYPFLATYSSLITSVPFILGFLMGLPHKDVFTMVVFVISTLALFIVVGMFFDFFMVKYFMRWGLLSVILYWLPAYLIVSLPYEILRGGIPFIRSSNIVASIVYHLFFAFMIGVGQGYIILQLLRFVRD